MSVLVTQPAPDFTAAAVMPDGSINEKFKSSDLIGIRPMLVTSEWIGHTVGVFAAIECKESGWKLRPGDARGQAQQRFIDLVRAAGGFAGFARSVEEARAILRLPVVP